MLENKIRKLIVLDKDKFLGIVTQTDLLKEFNSFAEHTMIDVKGLGIVRYLMIKDVVTIEKGSTALEAKNIMRAKKIDSVIVIDNGKPTGIITTKDFIDQIKLDIERLKKATVEMMMSSSLATLPPDISVFEANKMMLRPEYNFRRWPVVMGDELLGILSQTDISRGIVEFISQIAESIEKDEIREITVTKEY